MQSSQHCGQGLSAGKLPLPLPPIRRAGFHSGHLTGSEPWSGSGSGSGAAGGEADPLSHSCSSLGNLSFRIIQMLHELIPSRFPLGPSQAAYAG